MIKIEHQPEKSEEHEIQRSVLHLSHEEFKRKWGAGQINVQVNRRLAMQVMATSVLPANYRCAHYFWMTVAFLNIPIGLGLLFYKWWVGALTLFFTPIIFKSVRESAAQFMVDHALQDVAFYNTVEAAEVILISNKA